MLYKPSMLKLITMVSVSSECVSLLPPVSSYRRVGRWERSAPGLRLFLRLLSPGLSL